MMSRQQVIRELRQVSEGNHGFSTAEADSSIQSTEVNAMPFRDKLRKVTELLVEMPAEERKTQKEPINESQNKSLRGKHERPTESGLEKGSRNLKAADVGEVSASEQADSVTARPAQILIDTQVDFMTIYQRANVPAAPFTAEQMLEMLSTLPAELSLSAGRQMVSSLLKTLVKTIKATPENIGADAARKIEALNNYAEIQSKQTADLIVVAEKEIAAMQAQIEERQRTIESAQERLAQVIQVCQLESNRLNGVLEFFNVDVSE